MAKNIKSPCIQVCFVNPDTDLCLGCNRSIDEIEHWLDYCDSEREKIMAVLKDRKNVFAHNPKEK